MHKPIYIKLIDRASSNLNITTRHFSENWAIELKKNDQIKYITGCTFPINDSSTYKVARNKNICSEILTCNDIPNVPHHLIFSPYVLNVRKIGTGTKDVVQAFIEQYGFPFLIKKNNSSKGDGVYLVTNYTELEDTLSKGFITDNVLCLSPFRKILHEYRNIILNGKCLLSYEKIRPHITGDGKKSIINIKLLSEFYQKNGFPEGHSEQIGQLISQDAELILRKSKKIYLQWKHNTSSGTTCKMINNKKIKSLAIEAAKAINARFVAVDIIRSENYGFEVLEINASVVLNLFASTSNEYYKKAVDIFESAIADMFP